jgi:hypothetical protein
MTQPGTASSRSSTGTGTSSERRTPMSVSGPWPGRAGDASGARGSEGNAPERRGSLRLPTAAHQPALVLPAPRRSTPCAMARPRSSLRQLSNDAAAYRRLPDPLGTLEVQASAAAEPGSLAMASPGSACRPKALLALAVLQCRRPDIGSRVNREVHARFWEHAGVKSLRVTRQ